ncbi:pyruvoyl-dependent arginine decarboxylase [Candidatus Nomurabacteria bacterium]|nr:pyruvoyl-dependent arginine decarboxylase [Candidatus Nomurabacteria bacterium]
MNIYLTKGTGDGPTTLSAFDSALNDAGIANYNLLKLSSVIPPGSTILRPKEHEMPIDGEWGDRLYVVMAEYRTAEIGVEAWAGVGWVIEEESGKGLFVEHEGTNRDKVARDIQLSLEALMKTRGVSFGEINMELNGAICMDEPVCAMVVAVYKAESW